MEDDEAPRMSGALVSTEQASADGERGGEGSGLLSAPTAGRLSRSPSVLNNVSLPPAADGAAESSASLDESAEAESTAETAPLSKNQQKKLKRQQKWEDGREDRKRRRKEKRLVKQAQRRTAKKDKDGQDGEDAADKPEKEHTLVPVSLILDCDFESYMRETELISLSSQLTRSYASNRSAACQTRLYVSSWHGKMRKRYETLLTNQHKRWQHAYFVEGDFVEAAQQADEVMRGEGGGSLVDVLRSEEKGITAGVQEDGAASASNADASTDTNATTTTNTNTPRLVYLTSDSPNTISRLEPYTSYVIGGIVDKNREKGLCFRRAEERGIPTAKLPIGEYMVMASRKVLTTNHVVEIMLHWLETGSWATAFERVIPKRKGGRLRGSEEAVEGQEEEENEDESENEARDSKEVQKEVHEEPADANS